MVKVEVDEHLCVGCGLCSAVCPDVFRSDATGRSEVIPGSDGTLPCVKEAAEGCPVEAITVEE